MHALLKMIKVYNMIWVPKETTPDNKELKKV
jgi:hypothetical protein